MTGVKMRTALASLFLWALALAVLAFAPNESSSGDGPAAANPDAGAAPPAPVKSSGQAPNQSKLALDAAKAAMANFTPEMRDLLQKAYDQSGKNLFGSEENLSIISVPPGANVYIASVRDIETFENGAGDPVVEDALFQAGNLAGAAPLTVTIEPGEYVVGIREQQRGGGFDGGCVIKSTRDVITGGIGKSYHLYGISKKRGSYACLVSNFAPDDALPDQLGEPASTTGLFQSSPEALEALIQARTQVPTDALGRIAKELLRSGRAFYSVAGVDYFGRLGIEGTELNLSEWVVE